MTIEQNAETRSTEEARPETPAERRARIDRINADLLDRIRAEIAATGRKLKIGFLVNDNTKWNGGELLAEFARHADVEARIFVTLCGREKTQATRAETHARQLAFFRAIDPRAVSLYNRAKDKRARFAKHNVDVVFYQQPWGMRVEPEKMLGRSLAISMPYGFVLYESGRTEYRLKAFHPYIWRFFAQSDLHKAIHVSHDPDAEPRIVVAGYPKLDTYLDATPPSDDCWSSLAETADRRVIYAPHHSLHRELLRISTFDWNHDLMHALAERGRDVSWIYKPHGQLRYAVDRNGVMSRAAYAEYEASWDALPNAAIFDRGDYFDLFKTSTALITDCASFLGEYLPTGRPIIWLVAKDPAVQLNAVGAEIVSSFYQVRDRQQLEAIFDSVVLRGEDPLKSRREEMIRRHFGDPRPAATRVVDYVREALIPDANRAASPSAIAGGATDERRTRRKPLFRWPRFAVRRSGRANAADRR